MKTSVQKLTKPKWPFVTIDPALASLRNKVLFPEKLAEANTVLKTAKIPANKNSKY